VQSSPLVLTSLDTLVELGVSSNRYVFGVLSHARSPISNPFMKINRLKAALSKAEAEVVKAQKAAKAAAALATALQVNVRDAKRAFKETRRTYKQVRRFLKTATRDRKRAEKSLNKATARVDKLLAKSKASKRD
jgi:hypothetical protein